MTFTSEYILQKFEGSLTVTCGTEISDYSKLGGLSAVEFRQACLRTDFPVWSFIAHMADNLVVFSTNVFHVLKLTLRKFRTFEMQ